MVIVKSGGSDETGAPVVYFESDEEPVSAWGADEHRDRATDRVVEATQDALGKSVELARTCAARFSSGLEKLPDGVRAPNETSLELSISLDSEVGAILAKASASAQFRVTLTWQRQASDGNDQ